MFAQVYDRDNEHVLLEETTNTSNSFIGNINKLADNLDLLDEIASNINELIYLSSRADEIVEKAKIVEENTPIVIRLAAEVEANTIEVRTLAEETRRNATSARENAALAIESAGKAVDASNNIGFALIDAKKYAELAEAKANEADFHAQDAAVNANRATNAALEALDSKNKAKLSEDNARIDRKLADNDLEEIRNIRDELRDLIAELGDMKDIFVEKTDFYKIMSEIDYVITSHSKYLVSIVLGMNEFESALSESMAKNDHTDIMQSARITNNKANTDFLTTTTETSLDGGTIPDDYTDAYDDSGIVIHSGGVIPD